MKQGLVRYNLGGKFLQKSMLHLEKNVEIQFVQWNACGESGLNFLVKKNICGMSVENSWQLKFWW